MAAAAPAAMPATAAPKSNKMIKIIALALIGAVIGGELLAACIFLASAGQEAPAASPPPAESKPAAAAPAESKTEPKADEKPAQETPALEVPPEEKDDSGATPGAEEEVDLGSFSMTIYQPTSGTTMLVEFHLYGSVRGKDFTAFEGLYEKHKHRIRDQVIVTVRSSEIGDLTDPALGLIKRQILEKSNALLGKRLLRSIMFSDFMFIEQ